MDKVLNILGRTFISTGVLVFLFVGYQLWGTNITEARAQNRLQAEAESLFAQNQAAAATPEDGEQSGDEPGDDADPVESGSNQSARDSASAPPPAPQGSAVAVMRIPKIGLTKAIVEGTAVSDLKKGPGHYTSTPLPGQPGNAAIAGHRTTYGAPFGDIGELRTGDLIEATTRQGTFRYRVNSSKVVSPQQSSVLNDTSDNRLTLTTCHPKFSAAQRLIVSASLESEPVAGLSAEQRATAATEATGGDGLAEEATGGEGATEESSTVTTATPAGQPAANTESLADLSGQSADKTPAILWGLGAALVALMTWAAARYWQRWPAYIIGAPVFLIVLFIFFESFSRFLPANA